MSTISWGHHSTSIDRTDIYYQDDSGTCISAEETITFDRPIYVIMTFGEKTPPYTIVYTAHYRMLWYKPLSGQNSLYYTFDMFLQAPDTVATECSDGGRTPDYTKSVYTANFKLDSHFYFFHMGHTIIKAMNQSSWMYSERIIFRFTPQNDAARALSIKGSIRFQQHHQYGMQ